jgi:hypothetical protein
MTWSMPRPVLQLVALALGLACVGAFVMGALTARPPARLPGEDAAGGPTTQVIQAQEAQPFVEERIEGPPEPPPITEEERQRLEAEKAAKAEEAARAKAEAEAAAAAAAAAEKTLEPPERVQPKAPPPKAPQPKLEEPPF